MTDPDLTCPPSEIELAQLLAAVSAALGPSAALVLRRLACERDRLHAQLTSHLARRHGVGHRAEPPEPKSGPEFA